VFAFREQSERRDQRFKSVVVVLTLLTVGGMLGAILSKNDRAARMAYRAVRGATRALGMTPNRAVIDAEWRQWRQRWVTETRISHRKNYGAADPRDEAAVAPCGARP
jgi:hypothetical protein